MLACVTGPSFTNERDFMTYIRITQLTARVADTADRGFYVATDPPVVKAAGDVRTDGIQLARSVGQLGAELRSSWKRAGDR